MAEPTLLEEILRVNSAFVSGKARSLDPDGETFMVVACMDARLTGMLEQALGLPRKRAFVVRTAGNRVSRENHDALRSVAAGVYLKGVSEVFIVGHTDCGMAQFPAAEIIQRFRSAGVPRSAFGHEDIRTWFGAIADERANVLESAEFLRASGLFNSSVKVHGLLVDSETGAAELISNGYEAVVYASVARTAEEDHEDRPQDGAGERDSQPGGTPPLPIPGHEAREKGPGKGEAGSQAGEGDAGNAVAQTLSVVEYFLKQAQSSPDLARMMPRITDALRHEKNPVRIINLIERSIRDYGLLNPRAAGLFEQVRRTVRSRPEASAALMEMVRKLGR